MNWINNLLEGAITGLGMWLMMTVMGVLSFFALKRFFTKLVAKFWADIKKEGLRLDGLTIDGRLETKKKKKNRKKKQ